MLRPITNPGKHRIPRGGPGSCDPPHRKRLAM